MARQFTTKLAVAFLGTVSALAVNGAAQASCNGPVCHSSTSIGTNSAYTPRALSSWQSDVTYASAPSSYSSATQYSSTPTYSSSSYSSTPTYSSSSYSSTPTYSSSSYSSASTHTAPCPAGSNKQADGTCLSTTPGFSSSSSINYSPAPLTPRIIDGLGVRESLQPTSCPVAVHNPDGAQVLGCYNVVKPVAQPAPVVQTRTVVRTVPTVYQVVRPVVYLRYGVPVPCGAPQVIKTRYGVGSYGGGFCGR